MHSWNVATYMMRCWLLSSLIRISVTPAPKSFLGFQCLGSSPCCTRCSSNPAIFFTLSENEINVLREEPRQSMGLTTGEICSPDSVIAMKVLLMYASCASLCIKFYTNLCVWQAQRLKWRKIVCADLAVKQGKTDKAEDLGVMRLVINICEVIREDV